MSFCPLSHSPLTLLTSSCLSETCQKPASLHQQFWKKRSISRLPNTTKDRKLLEGLRTESSVAQWYPILCDLMDCSPPVPSVQGILQARTLQCCHFFLQGIFPTQGSNPPLLHLLALAGTFFTTEPPAEFLELKLGSKVEITIFSEEKATRHNRTTKSLRKHCK